MFSPIVCINRIVVSDSENQTGEVCAYRREYLFNYQVNQMRVRIKKHPFYDNVWDVQSKHWWSIGWVNRKIFMGDAAQERAFKAAKELLYPIFFETK